jgi:hypothetical protein
MAKRKYVRFDELENLLASLDMLAVLSGQFERKRGATYWKWLIIGAHDAVQAAIICAIADSTGTNVLSKKSARAVLDWLEDSSKKYPGKFMADFRTLLKRARIKFSTQERKDIRKLHGFRNEFVHFTPKSWSVELLGLPRIVGAALRLVERLMERDQPTVRMSGNRKRRLEQNLRQIRKNLGLAL